jgi:PAS domain S-box-containing protein
VQYVIPEPSLTLVLEKYAEAIREKKIVRWEETTEYPTGRVTGEVSIAPVFDDKGHCTQLVGTVHDITERKRMEEALKESQTLYYSFIEQLPNAVFRKDREGRYVLVNSQFCKLKGLKKEDFIGRKPNEVAENEIAVQGEQSHATKYANSGEDAHELIMRTGEILEAEEEYPDIDGNIRYMDVVRMPVFDYQGTVIGTQGIMFDVTERRKAEEALRINEERLNELFEEAPFGYHEMDEFGNICAVNRAELKMLGFTKEEMIGMPAWKDISDSEEARKRIFGKLAGKVPPNKNSERLVVRKDGTSFPALIDDVVLRNEEGKITGIRTTLLDITDRKRAEVALQKTSEEREKLIKELQYALENIRTLQGLIPICASCKKIRDDKGYWGQVEEYIMGHTDAKFSHGICPDCAKKFYGDLYEKAIKKN